MDNICCFSHDIPKATFSRKPSKLIECITWLEQNQKVRVTCDFHLMVKKAKVWSIKPEKQLVYKVYGLDESHKEKASDQNAGSLLKALQTMRQIASVLRVACDHVSHDIV